MKNKTNEKKAKVERIKTEKTKKNKVSSIKKLPKLKKKISKQKIKKIIEEQKIFTIIKKHLTKKNIFYLVLLALDIAIIIYSARRNLAQYISFEGSQKIFVGKTKNLLLGRNYITLITTIFFFSYIALSNKIIFKQKTSKKSLIYLLVSLLVINMLLFYIFTKRVI